jgi:hypothetical protein
MGLDQYLNKERYGNLFLNKLGKKKRLIGFFLVTIILLISLFIANYVLASSISGSDANLTIYADTNKFSNCSEIYDTCAPSKNLGYYIINFYANYSNTTYGPIIGNCSIRFNATATGEFTSFSIMNYSETNKLYQFNTSFDRRGNFTFEVNCSNSTYSTLNLTDIFEIKNSAPYQLLGPDATAQTQSCIEDSICTYNLSTNFTDDDVNDLPLTNFQFNNASSSEFQSCISINTITGVATISCTNDTQGGSHYFSAKVTDGGDLPSQPITIPYSISTVNDVPYYNTTSLTQTCTEDTTCSFYINAVDEENGSVTTGIGSGLGLLNFTDNSSLFEIDPSNGSIKFLTNPTNEQVGTYRIEINVSDANDPIATNSSILTLTIQDQNDAPIITYSCNDSREQVEDTFFSCYLNATDIDANESHTYSVNSSFPWFNFSCSDVSVTNGNSSCLVNFIPQDNSVGNHTINLTVTDDEGLTDSIVFSFNVSNIPDFPHFNNLPNNFTLYVNSTFYYNVNATDDDEYTPGGETIYYFDNSTLFDIDKSTGVIHFTPNVSIIGTHWVNISVNDSTNRFNSTIINFTVYGNSQPDYNGLFHFNITDNDVFSVNLTLNTTDINGDTFNFTDNTSFFNINSNTGVISFTANDSMVGTNWIRINITDSKGAIGEFDLNFTIYNVNETPVLQEIPNLTNEQEGVLISFFINANDEDLAIPNTPENLTFSHNYTGTSSPLAGISITKYSSNSTSAQFSYTPSATGNGTFWINISVNDTAGLVDSQVIMLNISDAASIPYFTFVCEDNRTAIEDVPYSCFIIAVDNDTGSYINFTSNYSFFNITDGTNVSTINGYANTTVSFTPTNDDIGNYTINITITDNLGEQNSTTIPFSVVGVNDAPIINTLTPRIFIINHAYTINISQNTTDEESDTLYFYDNTNMFDINLTTGIISFTPNSSYLGTNLINLTVNDSYGNQASQIVNYSVYISSGNATCTIFSYYEPSNLVIPNYFSPPNFPFNTTENSSIGKFSLTCTDPEDEPFTINFYFNNSLNKSTICLTAGCPTPTWSYNLSYLDAGIQNITIVLNDSTGGLSTYQWNVSVANLNAPPFMYSDIPNLTDGWDQDEPRSMNLSQYFYEVDIENISYSWFYPLLNESFISSTNTTFATNWSVYSGDWGIITQSSNQKLSQLNSSGKNVAINNQSLTDIVEYSTKVNFITQGVAGLCLHSDTSCSDAIKIYFNTTDNKTYWETSSDSGNTYGINLSLDTDYWLKVRISGNKTWIYSSTNGQYDFIYNLSNIVVNGTNVGLFTVDSQATFDDIKIKDPSIPDITVTINETTNNLTFTPATGFYGSVPLGIIGSDGNHSRESNLFYLIIDQVTRPAPITQTTTTHSSSTSITRQIASLDIIVPSLVSLTPLAKTIVPVVLNNSGQTELNVLNVLATTNASELSLILSNQNISFLGIGESVIVELEITAGILSPDRYTIIIDGYVEDPRLHEVAEIVIDVRERESALKTQLKEQIQFTRDLFLQNPECLELNELLEQAQQLYDLKQYSKGLELVHKANELCKNFIAEEKKRREDEKVLLKATNFFIENWKTIIFELSALLLAILLLMYYFKRRSFQKTI